MDEVAYLDHLTLDVVDRPPGVSATPDERFAPEGPRPTGELIAWRTAIEPVRATDLDGRDVTDRLRACDRRTVDGFRRLGGWIGYAEEHGIVLDFGDRLARFGPDDPLVLCLAGWVEYPYSQTNYAAATAGRRAQAPVDRAPARRRDLGGHRAPRRLSRRPAPADDARPDRQARPARGACSGSGPTWNATGTRRSSPSATARPSASASTTLPVARAALGYRGYTREVSPDGRQPLLYDYDYVDPAPLARMSGRLTRYGDVAALLRADDDRLCLVGPGDEVRLEFDAQPAPALPEGWTRSYVLRAVGYCKDADPFTATSDPVGPLPWRGMPAFPFGPEGERPRDPAYEAYLREYQTRPAGGP